MLRIEIEVTDDWDNILSDALFTQGKEMEQKCLQDARPVMSEGFFRKALASRHSVIRSVVLKIDLINIPYFVHTHLIRHWVGINWVAFVRTQRPDSMNPVGYDRGKAPQDAPTNLRARINLEGILTIMEKRLCKGADEKTIGLCFEIKNELLASTDPFLNILGQFCQPQCVWQGGRCSEVFRPCGDFPLLEVA